MRDCIFCRIAAGEMPAVRVLETPEVLAFLDIAPVNYGHTLVIPKAHYENLLELPDAAVDRHGPGLPPGGPGPDGDVIRPGIQHRHE